MFVKIREKVKTMVRSFWETADKNQFVDKERREVNEPQFYK